MLATVAISLTNGWVPVIDVRSAVLACLISAITGTLAGLAPAARAVRIPSVQRCSDNQVFGNRTQSEIAAEIGVPQMHISRLLARALARCAAASTSDPPIGSCTGEERSGMRRARRCRPVVIRRLSHGVVDLPAEVGAGAVWPTPGRVRTFS